MATDKTEPRTGLIATLAVTTVVSLVVIRAGLQSYFITMIEGEQQTKVNAVPAEQLDRLRAHEREVLERASVPLERAMATVAAGERPRSIEPRQSTDYGALQGWSLLPQPFHAPPAPPSAPVPSAAPSAAAPSAAPSAEPSAPAASAAPSATPAPAAPSGEAPAAPATAH